VLDPIPFYVVFALVVGTYIVLGGMAAAAVNESVQSVLIIVFSVLLIPTGLHAIGGWHALGERLPARMFDLFGSGNGDQFSVLAFAAILLVSVSAERRSQPRRGHLWFCAQRVRGPHQGVSGKDAEAHHDASSWAFAGLIAYALFGAGGLSDPDSAWGAMSNRLLGPGLIGLMLAGVLAGTMSTLAAKALAISSLFVRNVFRPLCA
jgi:Na+/pantothenate symporter